MDLIDEVDYYCCIFCDKIFPVEYELLVHVSEIHQDIGALDSKSMERDEIMEYTPSVFVEEDERIQCDEYYEPLKNNNSQSQKVSIYPK